MTRPKDIGTAAETAVVRYLRGAGWPSAERRALRGTYDAGDITGTPAIAWEVKAGAQAHQPPDTLITSWLDDLERERRCAGADIGILILRRRGKGDPTAWWAYAWSAYLAGLTLNALPAAPPLGVPVRLLLADVVRVLRGHGYGDPITEAAPAPNLRALRGAS